MHENTWRLVKFIGLALTIIGLIDLPDQIERWLKYFKSLSGGDVNWSDSLLGNVGRSAITFIGIGLLLVAYEVPQRLSNLFRRSLLHVDCEEGVGSFYQETPIQRPGFGKGILQLARVRVTNRSRMPIEDVQVKIVKVVPEQEGLLGIPFHLQRMNDNVVPLQRSTTFANDQVEYFDVVGYERFMLSTGRLHFRRIDGVDGKIEENPCDVYLLITGKSINSIECRFRVHVDDRNNMHMVRIA